MISMECFNIGICDDLDEYIDQLRDICKSYFVQNEMNCAFKIYHSSEELISDINTELDLLFLDIELPGASGIDAMEMLQMRGNIWRIVFVTSHSEQMGKAFGLKTLGFETKPVTAERVTHYLEIAIREQEKNKLLVLRGTEGGQTIHLSDLMYFEAASNYTIVHLADEQIKVRRTLKEIEQDYADLPLMRVHRSFVVNLMNVRNVDAKLTFWQSNESVPVGRKYRKVASDKFLLFLTKYARERS